MESEPAQFVVFAEAYPDAEMATALADRVVVEESTWIEHELLDVLRTWRGVDETDGFSVVKDIRQLYEAHRKALRLPRFLGHPRHGQPHTREYYQTRRAILLVQRLAEHEDLSAMVLMRDLDGRPERRADILLARDESTLSGFRIVVGAAAPKREAWVLNGFDPQDESEERALAELRTELGCDPRDCAETLEASAAGARRNAKRVLGALVGGRYEREAECWQRTSLETLGRRGQPTGLADYLAEVHDRLLPILVGRTD